MARKRLILAPLTAIAALGVVSPSLAAESSIGVSRLRLHAATQTVAVGDTVTWTFNDGDHTHHLAAGPAGQVGLRPSGQRGETFQKTFTKPGRYQYVCTPHESFMQGVLVVGTDTVKKTAGKVTAKVSGTR